MKKIFLFNLLLFTGLSVRAQLTVSGFVFEDLNRNGKKDRKEQGIPNVSVSNGQEVVLTGHDGRYHLPIGKDNIIFVIKPSGYSIPVNSDMLPQYYYIHKPGGSPDLKYKGVPPTGKLPGSVDFSLYPVDEKESFSMLLFGDPQVYNLQEITYFEQGIIEGLEGIENISFGLTLGDIVGDDLDLFNPYIQAVRKVGIPWYHVMGNHDMNFDVTADSLSDETFEAHFGPANYAFNYGRVHFILLDNILYPDPRGGKGYWGGLRNDQIEFVRNNLKHVPDDHLVVLAGHIPVNDEGSNTFRDEDRRLILGMLSDFPHTLSLSAHTHVQKHVFFTEEDGWKRDKPHHHFNIGTTCGSWYTGIEDENGVPDATMQDGTPKGYAFLHFNGSEYQIEYSAAGKTADHQMTIYAPKVVEYNSRSFPGIFVNFFIGHKNDKVFYRIENTEWKEMIFSETHDPSYVAKVMEWDFFENLPPGRRPSPAKLCRHLWYAFIPTKLDPGEHTIEIKAVDMFGNIHYGSRNYKIIRRE